MDFKFSLLAKEASVAVLKTDAFFKAVKRSDRAFVQAAYLITSLVAEM